MDHLEREQEFVIPHHSDIDDVEFVFDDFDGNIYGPIPQFISKYFAPVESYQGHQDANHTAGSSQHTVPTLDDFLIWFKDFFSLDSNGTRGAWHVSHKPILEPEAIPSTHLFLTIPDDPSADVESAWCNVQVVGEFCRDHTVSYQRGLLSLCALAGQVFARQPLRLFLHGFYIRQYSIEFWIFDRCGIYSSEVLSIEDHFSQFLSIIHCYRAMSDSQLGKSNFVRKNEAGNYLTIEGNDNTPTTLNLAEKPVSTRSDFLGGGTTCYLAKRANSDQWSYAVKFKWRLNHGTPETAMLAFMEQKNVRNVASLVYHEEIIDTKTLREYLRFGILRRFLKDEAAGSKDQDISVGDVSHYTEEAGGRFCNLTMICVVTTPVGIPLHRFESPLQLLQALCGAADGHRSLLQDAQILHQDVSDGNILIIPAHEGNESTGILIDYDAAIRLADQNENAKSISGTKVFMGIGVLRGTMHTYRHDLESFFYVLLWTIVSSGSGKRIPESSRLRQWQRGTFDEIAPRKAESMEEEKFQYILNEFPSEFEVLKPFAEKLRGLLFPLRDGVIFTGTDSSPEAIDELYDGFIGAFESAMTVLKEKQNA